LGFVQYEGEDLLGIYTYTEENKMQVVALLGFVQYEGEDLLGIYTDSETAIQALKEFETSEENDYDDFILEFRELGAAPQRGFLNEEIRRQSPYHTAAE
jgi:hypothetical protein